MTTVAENSKPIKPSMNKLMVSLLWLVIFCGVLFAAYKGLTQKNVLPIKEISFSGEFNQITARELHSLIVDGVSGNFFTLSMEELYQKFYALPWVEQIWVHRVWPDKINIEIREHEPVAILKDRGLLNEKGKVFTSEVTGFENKLPIFVVANNYEQEAIKTFKLYETMLAKKNIKIREFIFDKRKSQTLLLANNMKLTLGRAQTKQRLARFVKAYENMLTTRKQAIESIDLRYTNGFAVKWKQA